MRKISLIIVVLLVLSCVFSGNAFGSQEIFLYLGYPDSARVYRVTTPDDFQLPTGYFFDCQPAESFYVDSLKNFRFLNSRVDHDFKPVTGYIYRQIFDGNAVVADFGAGHSQHQDQRGEIQSDQAGRPVFRPSGAPFSAGAGRLVSESLAMTAMIASECEVLPGKNWYQIPNSSWYQTWNMAGDSSTPSYIIYFDRWEERSVSCVESFWRGYNPGMALERESGKYQEKRLLRARVDGAMELIGGDRKIVETVRCGEKQVFHVPSSFPGEGDLYFYSWHGRAPGKLLLNGKKSVVKIALESSEQNNRFAGLSYSPTDERRVYVVGSDIIKKWLRQCNRPDDNVSCDLAAFHFDGLNRNLIVFAYSSNHEALYRFVLNEAESGKIVSCEKIALHFRPLSMTCSSYGDLIIAALEVLPADFSDQASLIKGFEALHVDSDPNMPVAQTEDEITAQLELKGDRSGMLIFAKSYFAAVYTLANGQSNLIKAGEVFLDKNYVCCDFVLKNVSNKDLQGGIAGILHLAAQPGNSMSALRDDVPGFPNQHRRPEKVLTSVFVNPVE